MRLPSPKTRCPGCGKPPGSLPFQERVIGNQFDEPSHVDWQCLRCGARFEMQIGPKLTGYDRVILPGGIDNL